jgi:hypothetical protein
MRRACTFEAEVLLDCAFMNGRRCQQIHAESHDDHNSVNPEILNLRDAIRKHTEDTAETRRKYTNDETLEVTCQRTRNEGGTREASENHMPPMILHNHSLMIIDSCVRQYLIQACRFRLHELTTRREPRWEVSHPITWKKRIPQHPTAVLLHSKTPPTYINQEPRKL